MGFFKRKPTAASAGMVELSDSDQRAAMAHSVIDQCAFILTASDQTNAVSTLCQCLVANDARLALVWTWFGDATAEQVKPLVIVGEASAYARSLIIEKNLLTALGPVFQTLKGKASEYFQVSTFAAYPQWRRAAKEFGIRSVLAVPLATPGSAQAGLMVVYAKDNDYFERMGTALFESVGHVAGALLYRQSQTAQFKSLAYVDQMTGLLNRTGFNHQLTAHYKARVHPGTVVMIDIDRFKTINDRYGHEAGDLVVQRMGELLDYFVKQFRLSLNSAHHALPTGLCARWGGDEFIMFIYEVDSPAMMGALLRLKNTIENHPFALPDASALKVTASIGFTPCPDNSKNSFARAASLADSAMYAAKAAGGNAVRAQV